MKIRVIIETYSGLKPGVYDACQPAYRHWDNPPFDGKGDLFVGNHCILRGNYEIIRPASGVAGMGERIMTTTSP